jgi:DNA-binding GntR family transcriptional regulator
VQQTHIETLQSITCELTEAAAERNRDRYFLAKRSLHDAEVRAAYNHVLSLTMANLHAQSRRFWFTYEPTESFPEAAACHSAIVGHIASRNAEAAVAAVADLFGLLERLTKRVLDRRPIS